MSTDFSQDPVNNAIYNGMRRGIDVTLDSGYLGSAVILILSAIDTMGYLAMPENQEDVTPQDFINWAEKYIHFPCSEQITGADLFGARCAMLHTYGSRSRMSREGKCRVILWMSHAIPPIMTHKATPAYVMVSVPALRVSLFEGIDRFLVNTFRDQKSKEAELANQRLNTLVHKLASEDVLRSTTGN